MKGAKSVLGVFSFVVGTSLALWSRDCLRGIDVAVNIVFTVIAWFAFGASWVHEKWGASQDHKWQVVAPRLYWTAAILTVAIPVVSDSLGALMEYAPKRLDVEISTIVTSTKPSSLIVTSVPQTNAGQLSGVIPADGSRSSVAARSSSNVVIAPTIDVLRGIFVEVDWNCRVLPVFFVAGVLFVLLLFLWVVELATDFKPSLAGDAAPRGPESAR